MNIASNASSIPDKGLNDKKATSLEARENDFQCGIEP